MTELARHDLDSLAGLRIALAPDQTDLYVGSYSRDAIFVVDLLTGNGLSPPSQLLTRSDAAFS